MIGAIGSVSSSSKDAISKARKYYDSLDPEIQKQVGNYNVLTQAEKKFAEISSGSNDPEVKKNIGALKITLDPMTFEFNGKKRDPKITVGNLKEKTDYMVSFKNDIAIGTADATVTGIGKYTGKVTKKYTIIPARIMSMKLKKGKKKFTAKFKKSAGGVKYQIAYRINKSKKWTSRIWSSNKGTIKKLKPKKVYQVRVRGFKKTGGNMYYGPWTKIKKIKVR